MTLGLSLMYVVTMARKARYLAALVAMALLFGPFNLGHNSNCFAGQTVNVSTTANLQALVTQYPGATTFSLAPGIHRLQTVIAKSGDSFVGQTGAIISGAALLTSFTQSASYWTAKVSGVTQASSYPGVCGPTHPTCMYPEDLFFDNVPKTRVTSVAAVAAGKWYLNYSTGTAYMGDNPSGHTVEISELPVAFTGAAPSVIISNLTIEKYASVAQGGAINGTAGGMYWTVEGDVIRYNHGRGISTGNGMYITGNTVYSNGQLGIGGGGSNFTLQNNTVYSNNYAGYSYYWEAGGIKFSTVQNVMVEYNYSHNNNGPGFWNDIDSQYVTYNQNQASGNIEAGIYSELSYNITIENNYIWNDGYNPDGSGIWWGAGILVQNSSNVTIYSNSVSYCMDGIGGILASRGNAPNGQPYLLQNMTVTGNTITQTTGLAGGIVIEGTAFDNSVFTSWNNTFSNNTYSLSTPGANYFYWLGVPVTLNSFLAEL